MVNRTLSLGLYLSRICYLLNFLNLYIPLWLRKFFKFMVFRLLKKAFASQQTKSRHFYSCPLPPWAKLSPKFLLLPWYTGRLLISPGSICSKISPPKQKEGGENYEIKSDRIWSRRKAVIWATIKAILMTIIVGRWFLTTLFNEDPPEDLPPPLNFFPTPPPLCFCCLLSFAEYVIMPYLMSYFTEWYDKTTIVEPWYLIPEAPCYVFYATRRQVYCWFDTEDMTIASKLIWYYTHKHIQTQLTLGPIDWYINILTPPVMCSQQLPVLHRINHSLILKIYFAELKNIFAVQKLVTCWSHISSD